MVVVGAVVDGADRLWLAAAAEGAQPEQLHQPLGRRRQRCAQRLLGLHPIQRALLCTKPPSTHELMSPIKRSLSSQQK